MASQVTQYGLAQHTAFDFGITDQIFEAVMAGHSQVQIMTNPNNQLNEYDLNVIKSQLENITPDIVWGIAYEPYKSIVHAYHQSIATVTRADGMLAHGSDGAATAFVKKHADGKVPRPRNSFLIYRQEHHPVTVRQNPGMHNNEISKVIGKRWNLEPDEVKDKYAQLAQEEKRQHAIDNPDYRYKPRKPCQKKRRMTKAKLAKMGDVADNVRGRQKLRKVFNPAPPTTGLTAAAYAAIPTHPNPFPVNLGGNVTVQVAPAVAANIGLQNTLTNNISSYGAPVPVPARPSSAAINAMAAQYRQSVLADAAYNKDFAAFFDGVKWEQHFGGTN